MIVFIFIHIVKQKVETLIRRRVRQKDARLIWVNIQLFAEQFLVRLLLYDQSDLEIYLVWICFSCLGNLVLTRKQLNRPTWKGPF